MHEGEAQHHIKEESREAISDRADLGFLLDSEGRVAYKPELFSNDFNQLYGIYERNVATEVGLREINGGKTRDYERADLARRDAHIAAADQLVADLAEKGVNITGYEAESIIIKMAESRIPKSEEIPLLRKAFILDVYNRNEE